MTRVNLKSFIASTMICQDCKSIQMLNRPKSKTRELGHIKHLYCIKCRSVTAHLEVRGKQDAIISSIVEICS